MRAMIHFHGKHSWLFINVVILIIFSLNINICSSLDEEWWPPPFCDLSNVSTALKSLNVDVKNTSQGSSLDADAERWPWPTPFCNLTEPIARYTNGSKFVNTALKSLHVDVKNTSQGRFDSVVYGQSPNQIYALLKCRGDATAEECYNCSQQAKTDVNSVLYGQSPNQIYGLLQCRGDATAEECNNCSEQAKTDVLKYCGNFTGGRVWARFCFLRYNENFNFIGHMDTAGDNYYNEFNVFAEPTAYLQAVRQLLSNLSSDITSGSATDRYASGSTVDPGQFYRIYGLAQCWRDISLAACNTCLSTKIDELFKNNTGRIGARGLARSCIVLYGNKLFFNPSPAPPPQLNVAFPSPPKKSRSKTPILLGVLGGLFLLFIIVFLFGTRRRLKYLIFGRRGRGHYKGDDPQIREGEQPTSDGQVLDTTPIFSNVFTLFRKETLVAATQNFHDNNKLGEGGFGAVYKGTCPDGSEIAVKKLSLKSTQGIKEFLNEVELVAKIQHRNLVKLLGCCAEGSERLLVYEYLPNNSLDKILFDRNKRRQLDWQKRFNIILGVTRGLLYLHEDSHLRIIHRDIKPGNILMDSQMNPRIADFGLARLLDEDETNVRTIVAGTRGYMAPEYAMHGQLSAKADVYSFGTLLLELMSGRKITDFNLSPEKQILLEWAWGLYKRGNIVDMIDPAIIETCGSDHEQALRCIHVGLLCTQGNPSLRPSMSTVNVMLSTEAMVLPDPTKPPFVNSVATHHTNTNSGSPHSSVVISSSSLHTHLAPPSNADLTISELEPR